MKRMVCALAMALVLAGAFKQMAVIGGSPYCETLTPDNTFWWWWYGCDSGGGGSGAK